MAIEIEADKRGLIVKTPYSPQFVSELKRLIPASDRQFDGQSKTWIVSPAYGQTIQKLIMTVYREAVHLPAVKQGSAKLERQQIRVEYVGQCKTRPDGSVSAFGHDGQGWAYILPEGALKRFFGQDVEVEVDGEKGPAAVKQAPATLYAALLVKPTCTPVELKSAYRRLARQWHTDFCKEPDAEERIREINRIYEILSNPIKRKRYDAGLALEASYNKREKNRERREREWAAKYETVFFRAPLRCGLLTVDGEQRLGRVVVSKIWDWQDITDEQGRTLVTSWVYGADMFERRWA